MYNWRLSFFNRLFPFFRCLNNTDYLELSEKSDLFVDGRQYNPIDIFCGETIPSPIIAHKEIKFTFVSMRNSSFEGFKAKYEFIPKSQQRGKISWTCYAGL